MDLRLVLVVGDPRHISTCAAFSRKAALPTPARPGDVFHCPVGDGHAAVVAVAGTRLGGDEAVLVVAAAGVGLESPVAHQLATDAGWEPAPIACGLKGNAVGVFLDEDDWVEVPDWPETCPEQLQALVGLGLVDRFAALIVHDLAPEISAGPAAPLDTASVLPFRTRRGTAPTEQDRSTR